jgi:hypothetical protein
MHKYTNIRFYILLMNAYFTILDVSKPLKLYDPAVPKETGTDQPTNAGELLEDECTSTLHASDLDYRTTDV